MKLKKTNKISIYSVLTLLFLVGCSAFDNFTTYFNTYYNMERLMEKSEDEFEFMAFDKRPIEVYVPDPKLEIDDDFSLGPPPFMKDLIISQRQRQAVEVKLDSVIIKGSKILAFKSKTDYVEGAIFLMAKSYFYQEEWRPSEIKCSELVDKYPNSDFSPDAHLLFAKNALIQRNFYTGKIMLSRTVDIAWQKKRYDILSEAFRLQAELALYQDDKEEALRPYRQAVAQSDNSELSAKWQLELAALLYRIGDFEKAVSEFAKVREFSPTYEQLFESYLYEAECQARLKNFEQSNEILTYLEDDSKFEEWMGYTYAARLTEARMKGDEKSIESMENNADTSYVNNMLINTYNFERGMDFYKNSNYFKAQQYFAKARNQRTPIFHEASYMFKALSELRYKSELAKNNLKTIANDTTGIVNDTLKYSTAMLLFEAGRIQEELGNKDSVIYYYKQAFEVSPKSFEGTSKFIYSYARVIREKDPYKSDSLYEVVADNYATTPFGRDAMNILGFTEEFIVDTAQDLFNSGIKLKNFKDYPFAITQFYSVYERFPNNKLAPRALYNIGWLYEKEIKNLDSAIKYYDIILDKYPNSEYAYALRLPLAQLKNLKFNQKIPDSLAYVPKYVSIDKGIDVEKYLQNSTPIILPNGETQSIQSVPDSNNTLKLDDPSKFLDKAKEIISKPKEILNKINPLNWFNSDDDDKETPADSLKKQVPITPSDSTNKK